MSPPKTCSTCAHRRGRGFYARCDFTGEFANLSRKYENCPPDYSAWRPRQGLPIRIWQFFVGVQQPDGEKDSTP